MNGHEFSVNCPCGPAIEGGVVKHREAEMELHAVSATCPCQGCVFGMQMGLEGKMVRRVEKHS